VSGPAGPVLVIDTSTRSSLVVVGRAAPIALSRRDVRHRHGSHVLEQIDEALAGAGSSIDDIAGLAVGTGPGSFTGLRVGLATAKTIAYACSLRLVGVMSADALRRAAAAAGADPRSTVVLPAGARDHYLARPGSDPELVGPGGLTKALGGSPAFSVDLGDEVLGVEAVRLGEAAMEGLPRALLLLALERLEAGESDDIAGLIPAYVALPRGVRRAAEDLGWSPDLR